MANRMCPLCFGKVPRASAVAHTNDVMCPQCGRTLELSLPSRLLASFLGLAAAWLAFDFTSRAVASAAGLREWILPAVASLLAFGVVSPLFLLFSADLVVKQEIPEEPLAAPPAHGHGHRAPH